MRKETKIIKQIYPTSWESIAFREILLCYMYLLGIDVHVLDRSGNEWLYSILHGWCVDTQIEV